MDLQRAITDLLGELEAADGKESRRRWLEGLERIQMNKRLLLATLAPKILKGILRAWDDKPLKMRGSALIRTWRKIFRGEGPNAANRSPKPTAAGRKKRPLPPPPMAAKTEEEHRGMERKTRPPAAQAKKETKEAGTPRSSMSWPSRIQSTVVVPSSHRTCPLGLSKSVNWVKRSSNSAADAKLASEAVLLDYRPRLDPEANAVLVLWDSRTVHCGGHVPRGEKFPPAGYLHRGLCSDGHFRAGDAAGWKRHLEAEGFCVLELAMTANEHAELIAEFRRSVQLMNRVTLDLANPQLPPLETISRRHLPPYVGKGLQTFYGMAHTPYADRMRLHPEVRRAFEVIYGTKALACSLDAPAIHLEPPTGKNVNWLHQDQDARHTYLSVQGCLVLRSAYARLAQMVSWQPLARFTGEQRALCASARQSGSSMTHDNARVNKKPLPTFRPDPRQFTHLRVYNAEAAKELADEDYEARLRKLIPPEPPSPPSN